MWLRQKEKDIGDRRCDSGREEGNLQMQIPGREEQLIGIDKNSRMDIRKIKKGLPVT